MAAVRADWQLADCAQQQLLLKFSCFRPHPTVASKLIKSDAILGTPGQSFLDDFRTCCADKGWDGLHLAMHNIAQSCCDIAWSV